MTILSGVLAQRRKQPRGKANTGIVLGSLAAVASVLFTGELLTDELPMDEQATGAEAAEPNPGTKEDPHRVGTRIICDNFELILHSFSDNATEQLLE